MITQILIVLLGGLTVWLLARRDKWQRWGFIVGLISEPVWFYATLTAKPMQIGVVILAIWYTYAYCQGIYNYWIANDKDSTKNS